MSTGLNTLHSAAGFLRYEDENVVNSVSNVLVKVLSANYCILLMGYGFYAALQSWVATKHNASPSNQKVPL